MLHPYQRYQRQAALLRHRDPRRGRHSLDHIFIQDLGSVEGEGAAFHVDADGQLTLGSTRLLSSAAYPRGLRVRDVSLRYDSASGIFTVTLQVGTVDSTLAETSFEVRRLNHT